MQKEKIITLAGNPNVGKSTIFNAITGMKQHTGNWIGKTVQTAKGNFTYQKTNYTILDIPGTYSLISQSKDEQVARDFICFQDAYKIVVVCDATALERNLGLFLQILECRKNVVLCINLIDEAEKKNIFIDKIYLEKTLKIPVVMVSATKKQNLQELFRAIEKNQNISDYKVTYPSYIEEKINILMESLEHIDTKNISKRWVAIKLLENDKKMIDSIEEYLGYKISKDENISKSLKDIDSEEFEKDITKSIAKNCEDICKKVVKTKTKDTHSKNLKIDKIVTSKKYGIPIMLLLLFLIFWITIVFANYPSTLLSNMFFYFEDKLRFLLTSLSLPTFLVSMLVDGVYKVVTWVVSVMLPPMAIFFPLFTLLEDFGYLPRLAFNMDRIFEKCKGCGKQALTMCMGFGCNACAINGSRIITSDRERLLAIITNNFVPCNGRFPTLIAIIGMFFVFGAKGLTKTFLSALLLTSVIILGIAMTFLASYIASKTFLKGESTNFTLELPPYRKPQIIKTVIRSIFDKTIVVLARAVVVALPAGVIIWLMANVYVGDNTLLFYATSFLEPLGQFMGLDGVILLAFILGFPANEIVFPIIIMCYMRGTTLIELDNLNELKTLLIANGWTIKTALCTAIFCMFHWPCSTTCLTIKKETKSLKWTFISIALPTIIGVLLCVLINIVFNVFM